MDAKQILTIKQMLGIGHGSPADKCNGDAGEYLYNPFFNCGLVGWGVASPTLYPALLTDNGDGTVTLTAESTFGSIGPARIPAFDTSKTYELRAVVTALTGNGKVTIRRPNGNWESTFFTTTGAHVYEFTGPITEIHVGADGDATAEMTFDEITLREKITQTLTTNSGEPLETNTNEPLEI
jgi:hypothetical protein